MTIDLKQLEEALTRAELWEPSKVAKMAYDDYNSYVEAARAYLLSQRVTVIPITEQNQIVNQAALDAFNEWMETPTNGVPPASRKLARHANTIRTALTTPSVPQRDQDVVAPDPLLKEAFEALEQIAKYPRGGEIRIGSVEEDRDFMIGLARTTRDKLAARLKGE